MQKYRKKFGRSKKCSTWWLFRIEIVQVEGVDCNIFYVGQSSKSARVRINQHIKAIINFKPFVNNTNEVGYHFNLKGHNYKRDFRFFIFNDKIIDKFKRLSIETDLINIIQVFNPPIINKMVPSIFKIKTFAYL